MTASRSMRFSLDEVLSGMLATLEGDTFPDDADGLAAHFENLAGRFTLFAPFAGAVDHDAVNRALAALSARQYLDHQHGEYSLNETGRAHCVSSKRTLFNRTDCEQLEAAAAIFHAA